MGGLTVKGLAKLTQPGRHGDGNGLHVFVQKTGTRSWVQRIVINGKRRDIGLGSLEYVSLRQAREEAYRNRVEARHGRDPFAGRVSRIPTFAAAAAKVAEADRARLTKTSATAAAAAMAKYALPVLRDRRVDQIGKVDVLKVLSPIWTETPAIAKKVRGLIRAVLGWAVAHDHVEHNVVDAISGALPAMPVVREHMRALPFRDVPEALRKIDACGASQSARAALRFLILTAARTGEVRGASWGEIDLEGRMWTIQGARMKAGRVHRVPLSDAALAVLDGVRALRRGNDLLFPSPTGAGMLATVTLNNTMKSAGLGDRGTPHGFRSSFRDWAGEETDTDHAVMELSLAHQVGTAVERSYARSDLFDRRRSLMDAWAEYVTS